MRYWTTDGDVRGSCGHRHRSLETAKACLQADIRGCRAQGGYSDREIVPAEPAGEWHTIVTWGGGYSGGHRMPPRGPFRSWTEAEDALARWAERAGEHAGTLRAAHRPRIVGPFDTRAEAREADISDG